MRPGPGPERHRGKQSALHTNKISHSLTHSNKFCVPERGKLLFAVGARWGATFRTCSRRCQLVLPDWPSSIGLSYTFLAVVRFQAAFLSLGRGQRLGSRGPCMGSTWCVFPFLLAFAADFALVSSAKLAYEDSS